MFSIKTAPYLVNECLAFCRSLLRLLNLVLRWSNLAEMSLDFWSIWLVSSRRPYKLDILWHNWLRKVTRCKMLLEEVATNALQCSIDFMKGAIKYRLRMNVIIFQSRIIMTVMVLHEMLQRRNKILMQLSMFYYIEAKRPH